MGGRWFTLAISAHAQRSLDFKYISRDDPKSLVLENIVLNEIERERDLDFKRTSVLYTIANLLDDRHTNTILGSWAGREQSRFYDMLFPWLAGESEKQINKETETPEGVKLSDILSLFKKG